jgi:hypothetical protein
MRGSMAPERIFLSAAHSVAAGGIAAVHARAG